jgi:hypothetical protein
MEGRLKVEPWRVCISAVVDSHYYDEVQNPGQGPLKWKVGTGSA